LPNSIGYVEYAYAKQNKMAHVTLRNQSGNFVEPSDAKLQGLPLPAQTGQRPSIRC